LARIANPRQPGLNRARIGNPRQPESRLNDLARIAKPRQQGEEDLTTGYTEITEKNTDSFVSFVKTLSVLCGKKSRFIEFL
jgi:hypothetical protein